MNSHLTSILQELKEVDENYQHLKSRASEVFHECAGDFLFVHQDLLKKSAQKAKVKSQMVYEIHHKHLTHLEGLSFSQKFHSFASTHGHMPTHWKLAIDSREAQFHFGLQEIVFPLLVSDEPVLLVLWHLENLETSLYEPLCKIITQLNTEFQQKQSQMMEYQFLQKAS